MYPLFVANRNLYMLLIKASSPKIFIQQSNSYTIDGNDILSLPINIDNEGYPIPFKQMDGIEKSVIEDTLLLSDNLNNSSSVIFNKINPNLLSNYCDAFCEILNLTYEDGEYKFRAIRQIINDDYVWTTFEHTNNKKEIESILTNSNKIEFDKIFYDEIFNNALTINRIIVYYGKIIR